MAAFADDFDDLPEDDSTSPPLPAEDRLWRHPSELGSLGTSLPLDPITVRRRWLASQPTRASAWTAGLVGAILATGLVALGTHLASAITSRSPADGRELGVGTALASRSTGTSLPAAQAVGSALAAQIATVGRSLVYLDVTRGSSATRCLGIGVRSDGMLLAPAAEVVGATSVMVTLPDGMAYVGTVVASDMSQRAASSGLALIHINGVTDLAVAPFEQAPPSGGSELAVALTAPGGTRLSVGSVETSGATTPTRSATLVDAMTTDLATSAAPPGSALLGAHGGVLGIVTSSAGGDALATPAWIASGVVRQLLSNGTVDHGWLGIDGATASAPVSGVRVTLVTPSSAAWIAGVRPGDVIVSVAGHRVTSMAELQGRLYFEPAGARVPVRIDRGGRTFVVDPVLGDAQLG
ncbi:MAG TPA: PDZ domain-containing protein [Acidimicrobiales bacterium]|nr:PDZ domain-containing protein [Acidimicrobiales bacterium]